MSCKQNDIWMENLQELEDERYEKVKGLISRATTSHLEHQRDTYWEMVCEQLDTKHQQFLVTLTMIDREILAREIKSVEEAKKQI